MPTLFITTCDDDVAVSVVGELLNVTVVMCGSVTNKNKHSNEQLMMNCESSQMCVDDV